MSKMEKRQVLLQCRRERLEADQTETFDMTEWKRLQARMDNIDRVMDEIRWELEVRA